MTYSKSDIEMHGDNPYGPAYPAVNVKVRRWPTVERIVETFGCSEATAENASEYAYEMHAESFWENAPEVAKEILGYGVADHRWPFLAHVYSAGRSSGWLIVKGLPPIEAWDAIAVAKWGRFETVMRAEVKYLCSEGAVLDSIRANEWALDADAIESAMQAV